MVLGGSSPGTTEILEIMNKTRSLDFMPVTQESTSSPTMVLQADTTTPTYMIQAETEVRIVEKIKNKPYVSQNRLWFKLIKLTKYKIL